jgi:DNA-binding PadR family transcriptional regulator
LLCEVSRNVGEQPVRRPLTAAEPARHALLGLLLAGPSYGYDLARAFAPGTVLDTIMHLGASHLYALLAQLERDGLVIGQRLDQGARPPRRVFALTGAGRDLVQRWLDEPVARPRDIMLDFPLKLYRAHCQDPVRSAALIARQRALFRTYLDSLEHEQPHAAKDADAAFLWLLHDGRVERARSALAWLDRCAETLVAASLVP